MSDKSGIEWTDATWNPVTGCSKVSQGCKHCYAERAWPRLAAPRPKPNIYTGRAFTDVMCHPEKLDIPLRWTKPRRIFVNAMSDLFHASVPDSFIIDVFNVMSQAILHEFQVLTKRAERVAELSPYLEWTDNIWMGVSVENEKYKFRIDHLRETGAKIKFLSLEPLIGPLGKLNLKKINWVIVGGESGPGARPVMQEWVTDIRDQCLGAKVPFFFKQWGGVQKKRAGRSLEGRTWDEMPVRMNLVKV